MTRAVSPATPHVAPPGLPVRRLALAVAAAAILAHVGVGAGGAWSFEALNYDDPQVLALARDTPVDAIVTGPVWYAYKPVYFLSLKVDTLFGDAAPAVAHVHNLLLHALCAALLVVLLAGLLRRPWVAAAAGLLFAVHPVHVESVAWISGRKDVLSLALVLAAHLVYRDARARGAAASVLAPGLLLLGGLAKGTVWIWAGVLALDEAVEVWRARTTPRVVRRALVRLAPCVLVALAGLGLDAAVAVRSGPGAVEHGVSTVSLAASMAAVHALYLFHLLVPVGLALDYAVDPAGSWAALLPWVGLALLVGAALLLARSVRLRSAVGLTAAGLWLLGLLPVNNLWPRTATLMADRYLYVPALGVYVLLAVLLARFGRARTAALAVAAVVLLVLCARRTAVFASSEAVWADTVSTVPHSALAWFQRGQAAAARQEWERAESFARRAIDGARRAEIEVKARLLLTGAALGRIGEAEVAQGRPPSRADLEGALGEANRAARLAEQLASLPSVKEDPREVQAEAEVLRGKVLERWHDPASALEAYEKATQRWPAHATAHYNLATLLAGAGTAEDLAEAESHLRTALRLRPAFLDAALQLANVLALQGRVEDALRTLESAERRHGRTAELLFAQAQVHLAARQDVAKAEALLQEIERREPDDPRASRLLSDIHLAQARLLLEAGRASRDRGKLRQALERFEAAGRARERSWEAELGAGDALLQMGRFADARERYRRADDLSGGLPWIRRLVARAAVLEAAWTARHAEDDLDRSDAARLVAAALRAPVRTIDLGFLALNEELDLVRAVARRFEEGGDGAEHAGRVLRALALALSGDEEGARRELRGVFTALAPDTEERSVLDAALLLRGLLRDRAAQVDAARRDFRHVGERRPDDALPQLRLLELGLREAYARLSIARGFPDQPQRIEAAAAEVARRGEAVRAFADEHPPLLAAGLLAVEAAMHRFEWVDALRRLNELRTRFPREPAVWRGQSAVYMAQYFATREPLHLADASRALRRALTLDPREPRTLLDASQVARVAGQLPRAVDYARRALAYELVPAGPAARALGDLHVVRGRQALERGDGSAALAAAAEARAVDAGAAAPWILEGDVYLRGRKYDEALEAYRTAKELEPLSAEADRGLARIHAQRALIFQVRGASVRTPPHPRTGDGWAALDDAEREAAVAAWREEVARAEDGRQRWRAHERRELEAALRLDPDAEKAAEMRRRLASLRSRDEASLRAAYEEANQRAQEGRDHFEAGELADALDAFQGAVDLYPDHLPGHVGTAATLHALLRAPPGTTEEERQMEARYWNLAFTSLHAADKLDPLDRFPQRHRVRGQLNELRYRREGRTEARTAATRAYQRFVRAMESAGREEETAVHEARRRVAELLAEDGR